MTLDEIGLRYGTDKSSRGHDYLRHYERVLSPLRDEAFTMIEIGGLNGASLQMWRDFLPRATIVCVDIKPDVKRFEEERIRVEIGDSGSPEFLAELAAKYPSPRVILDDGSHRWDHQRIAFLALFPVLEPGGLFIIEDLHTNYEPGFAGRDDVPFVELLKNAVDFLNLRGERSKDFRARQSRAFARCVTQIDSMLFVRRSCIIGKRVRSR